MLPFSAPKLSHRIAITLIALALAVLGLSLTSENAQAQVIDQGTCGSNATWILDDNGTLTIDGTGPMDNYSKEDWAPWTQEVQQITSIVVSEGVTSVGDYAFWYCINATNADLPSSIANIGLGAFANCSSLTQITIPEGVITLEPHTFNGCGDLASITLPESLQAIKGAAFANCASLATVTIPCNVTSLGNDAFNGCESLTNVNLPNSLAHLGDGAFANCTSLEKITIPSSIASVSNSSFWGCTKLANVQLQEGTTEICWGAFSDCPALTSIVIPRSVTAMEESSVGVRYNYDTEQFDPVEDFALYGYADTAAQDYAAATNLTFVDMESRSGGDCLEVEVAGSSPDRTLTTYEGTQGELTIMLNGVTNENAQNLADAIAMNSASKTPVKFINDHFVDADKYSTLYQGYDSLHCWLSSASNALLISGWSQGLDNPLLSQQFQSEDSLFIFLTSNMTDQGGASVRKAYSYFFDGLYASVAPGRSGTPTTQATAAKPSVGIDHAGFFPELCSDALISTTDLASDLNGISVLNDFGGHAYEMVLGGAGATHSVTVVGAVIDQNATGTDAYKALLIADSDNEVSSGINQPNTMEQAYAARSSKTNSYTMYFLEKHEVFGEMCLCLKDYNGAGTYTPIDSITSLAFRSDAAYANAFETAPNATKDASSTADISLRDLFVINDEFDERPSYKVNEPIMARAFVVSMNDKVEFNATTAGSNILQNKLDISRDGQLVASLVEEASVDLTSANIDAHTGEIIMIDLTPYCSLPGEYRITMSLNTANLPEAYILNNNSPLAYSFSITEAEPEPDPKPDPRPDPNPEPDPNKDNPKPHNPDSGNTGSDSQSKSLIPATGDNSALPIVALLTLASLAVALLAVWRAAAKR